MKCSLLVTEISADSYCLGKENIPAQQDMDILGAFRRCISLNDHREEC